MMKGLYEIDYQFLDELNEEEMRTAYVIVYNSNSEFGNRIEQAEDEDDYSLLDGALREMYGIKDEDVSFYCDMPQTNSGTSADKGDIICHLQYYHDIHITRIEFVKKEPKEK